MHLYVYTSIAAAHATVPMTGRPRNDCLPGWSPSTQCAAEKGQVPWLRPEYQTVPELSDCPQPGPLRPLAPDDWETAQGRQRPSFGPKGAL